MKDASSKATLIGSLAIVQWSSLAVLTTFTGQVPPLQLTAMALSLATVLGWPVASRRGLTLATLRGVPKRAWANGIWGLFGYHFFYFLALRSAPVVEANLVNYLWPLLFLLFSTLLPGERLHFRHILGTVLGFGGAALLVTGGKSLQVEWAHLPGYASALTCAVAWSSYSVLSRKFPDVPTTALVGFCGATALGSWVAHFILEDTLWPVKWEWLAVVVMGVGPMGVAFFLWDHGVKRGRIAVLASLSYFAPLISTLLLIATGQASAHGLVYLACVMITGGALVASGILSRNTKGQAPESG